MTLGRYLAGVVAAVVLAASLSGCQQHQSGGDPSPLAPAGKATSAGEPTPTQAPRPVPSATKTLIIPPTRIPPHPPLSLQPT